MLNSKSQYINLKSVSDRISDKAERKYLPETRTVYLSRRRRKLFDERGEGIPVLESGRERPRPILDPKRILKVVLYGLGLGLVLTGVVFLFDRKQGE